MARDADVALASAAGSGASVRDQIRTTELGQFTDANAERIAGALEGAGIVWWHKGSGRLTRVLFAGDWGVRIFVDEARLDEARALAAHVVGGG